MSVYCKLSPEEMRQWIKCNWSREGYVPSLDDFEKELQEEQK